KPKTRKKRRPYPPKHREHLAQKAREHKPWTASTGPKTSQGKAASARNATKHGLYGEDATTLKRRLARLLKLQKTYGENILGTCAPCP
ncbi:MAG: hypothetical protein JKY71_12255, partial [Alphaproteobacteria bacterium]|nr:hypothetical protein [Alphaproteobacteria bacterium]